MSDRVDDGLRAIGQAMSALDADLDPRIERLAHGTLSADEEARLREDAVHDSALRTALEMCEPLSKDFEDKLVGVALDAASPPRRARIWPIGVAAVAAAAAVLLLMVPPDGDALPAYRVEYEPTAEDWRGAASPTILDGSTEIAIVMRPMVEVSRPVGASLFVVVDGAPVSSSVVAEVSPRGTARWVGEAGVLARGQTGEVRLVAVVSRPGAAPRPQAVLGEETGDGWQARSFTLRLRP